MSRSAPHIVVFLVLLVYLCGSLGSHSGEAINKIRCKEAERQALLNIKGDLSFSKLDEEIDVLLSSWGKEEGKKECCEWIGIRCDNKSGHVISLDLSPSTFHMNRSTRGTLAGNINSSLSHLQYLNYLDLSGIDFGNTSIPSSIGGLTKIRYLNLSHTGLSGAIPPQLGNLSSLQFLDLNTYSPLTIKNLEWVSRLSSLKLLDLSGTYLSLAHDWMHVFSNLPHLTILLLHDCDLPNITNVDPPSLSLINSSKLFHLDLSQNSLSSSTLFQWVFEYTRSLVHLDLSGCMLQGPIPNFFGNMTALTYLDLSANLFGGSIPQLFGNLTAIKYLDLGENRFKGSITQSFGNMTALEFLDFGHNMIEGEIPKSIWEICTLREVQAASNNLSRLQLPSSSSQCVHCSLEYLDLSQNRIMGSLPNFTLYPSLIELDLSSNQLNGNVSESIGQLSQLKYLDISNNSIQCVISEAHLSKLFNLLHLDFSYNTHIVFNIHSDWIAPFQLHTILLGSCKLGRHFPKWISMQKNYSTLNISNSGISHSIPDLFWINLPTGPFIKVDMSNNGFRGTIRDVKRRFNLAKSDFNDYVIDLSSNQLEGSIPLFLLQGVTDLILSENRFSELNSIFNATNSLMGVLDVSSNQLAGELPDCWSNMKNLVVLYMANNKLTGKIPNSIGSLTEIRTLQLSNNNLTGELPSSLQNCKWLKVLNVGENKLLGPIPAWIGTSLTGLTILSLRSNHFYGSMPSQLCHLIHLQVLDLSSNNVSGSIPTCLHNISNMKDSEQLPDSMIHNFLFYGYLFDTYEEKLLLEWKGALSVIKNLILLKLIDLSSNKLVGEIPREVTELIGLICLNLSRNNLSGQIPKDIGRLKSLDVLDLSKNHLIGRIPSSLSQVDRLNTLDLSSNNLSGKIPTGTQLQMRDAAAYMGNPELCGDPLPQKCLDEEEPTADRQKDQDEFITKGFYVSIGLGFVVGFWGVCLTLIFNKPFRYGYFKLLNKAEDWIYVVAAVHKAKLLRIIKS